MIELTRTDLIESYSPLSSIWNQTLQKVVEEICKQLKLNMNNNCINKNIISMERTSIIFIKSNSINIRSKSFSFKNELFINNKNTIIIWYLFYTNYCENNLINSINKS